MQMKRFVTMLLCLLILVCGGLRVYTICTNTEAETGFLLREDWSSMSCSLLLIVGSVTMAVFSRKTDDERGTAHSSKIQAVSLVPALFGILLDTVALCLQPVQTEDMLQFVWWIAVIVLGFAAVLLMAMQAVLYAKASSLKLISALYLIPALWFACRALMTYLNARMVITVPALLLEVVALLLICGVWSGHARMLGNVDAARGSRLMRLMLPAALLCGVVCVLPAAIAALLVGSAVSPVGTSHLMIAAQLPTLWLLYTERG